MARLRAVPRPALLPLLALGLALSGCKSKSDDAASTQEAAAKPGEEAKAPDPDEAEAGEEPSPKQEQEADDPRAAAVEITKSEAAASTKARGARGLGFSLEKISHLFALKAAPKVPEWGASGEGEVKLVHDDDLDTAWRCEFGQAEPCVLGLALPEKAKVEVVRLYTAAGPRYRDYKGHPRVKAVRVHTEAGWLDAELHDGADHAYVRFAEPVETQSLAVEVTEIYEGKQDTAKLVHIAEVEVYGTDGVPRPPIALDPAQSWVGWETTMWDDKVGDHTIRQVFVYFARPGEVGSDEQGPPRRRFARATAAFGQAGDDYMLIERLYGVGGTGCDEVAGNYMLYDKRNRMAYSLRDLGGAGGQVFRHAEGRGFAVGWMNDEGQFTVKGVVEEGGKLKWKRPPKQGAEDGAAVLRSWGFDPEPLARGVAHGGAVAGCHRGGTGELEPVIAAAKLGDDVELDPAQWMICTVGGDALYASAPCDAPARAYQLDASRNIVGEHASKEGDARGLRLRRAGDRLFVELSAEQGNTATLILAEPGRFTELERDGGLYVRPPSSCEPCTDAWTNPEGAVGAGEADELDEAEGGEEDDDAPEDEPTPSPG
jgi:hypothetical protein